jgi:hypothetical protein
MDDHAAADRAKGVDQDARVATAVGRLPEGHVGLSWSGSGSVIWCGSTRTGARLAQVTPAGAGPLDDPDFAAVVSDALDCSAVFDESLRDVASRLDTDLRATPAHRPATGLLLEIDGSGELRFVAAGIPGPLRVSPTGAVALLGSYPDDGADAFGDGTTRLIGADEMEPGDSLLILSWQARAMLTEREIRQIVAECARPQSPRPAIGLAVAALWTTASTRAERRLRPALAITAIARDRPVDDQVPRAWSVDLSAVQVPEGIVRL